MTDKLSHEGADVDVSCVSKDELRLLFDDQCRYMQYFFDNLDHGAVETCCQVMLECVGSLFLTGVGKSGFIAQKLSQILVSTGTRAIFLNPTDALHGDIGIVKQHDVLLAFSKSGSTEELVKLIPYAKVKGAYVVSVTCLPGSLMEQASDISVVLPLERELCPFNLAPVTSTAIQMVFGDTIAIALMKAKQLSKDQYAMNHPAGRIGKRLMLNVDAVMAVGDAVPVVSAHTTLLDALSVLSSKGCGCVVVMDGDALQGIFTDGDLRRTMLEDGPSSLAACIGQHMCSAPKTIVSGAKAVDALKIMQGPNCKVQQLPVVDGNCLKGLVTIHHLLSAGI